LAWFFDHGFKNKIQFQIWLLLEDSVAVRVPNHEATLALLESGFELYKTSKCYFWG
jgi:tRNA A37 threonylcarbamoyladenosine synthetase subunit TsaC/SUA5/YrdC